MGTDPTPQIHQALRLIPCGLFVLTSHHEGSRSGLLTRWVQPCSAQPPLVMVAVATGLAIEPLIRDSRWFALCQIGEDDRILRRRFAVPADRGEDPFVTLPHTTAPSGAPILERAITWMDCELIRHVDLDSDHRLYVGRVHHAGIMTAGARPVVEVDGAIATIQDNSAA